MRLGSGVNQQGGLGRGEIETVQVGLLVTGGAEASAGGWGAFVEGDDGGHDQVNVVAVGEFAKEGLNIDANIGIIDARRAEMIVGDIAVNVALGAVGEFALGALAIDDGVGNFHARRETALADGRRQRLDPVGLVEPIVIGEDRLDAAVALHIGMPIGARVFGGPGLTDGIVRKNRRGGGALFRVHQAEDVDVIDGGHLQVVEDALDSLIVQVPGVDADADLEAGNDGIAGRGRGGSSGWRRVGG